MFFYIFKGIIICLKLCALSSFSGSGVGAINIGDSGLSKLIFIWLVPITQSTSKK
ncbi:hypothetical protein HOG27_04980 [bacterium]|jgi:hypothetical protein|nr:hypothetical protein [bacterium]